MAVAGRCPALWAHPVSAKWAASPSGFGALGWLKLAGSWGNLIDNSGIGTTCMIYGAAFVVLVLIGSVTMKMAPRWVAPPAPMCWTARRRTQPAE